MPDRSAKPLFNTEHAEPCPECGHVHAGEMLGYICIGCPCPLYPSYHGEIVTNDDHLRKPPGPDLAGSPIRPT